MRLALFLVLVGLLSANASVYSQNAKLSIDVKDLPMRDALRQVEKASGKRFFMSDDLAVMDSRISVKVRNKSFEQVMREVLKGYDLSYKLADNGMVIITEDVTVAQEIRITGMVTDERGEPLPGVSVQVKGMAGGVVTDLSGEYTLTVPNNDATLIFSYMGYLTAERAVGNDTKINMPLHVDNQSLEEVVVVGYGTQRKVNLTGAVESVGSEVFENRSTSNTTQALQGAVPNLNISLEDGKPTRSASFNVRGRTSIGQGGSALILIDGVEGDPSFLNPNDIESVSVLKDAASAAIYGARGSFGVVLITTKRPQKGRTTINYTGNTSVQSQARKPEFVTDAVTWVEHFRESYYNRQGTVPTSINNNTQYYSDEWLERLREWKASGEGPKTEVLSNGNYEYYSNTDWLGLLFKDRTFTQDHNLTLSGGNDKADFYVSGRFYDFDGIYNFDPDTYRSYNLRAKGSLQAYPWLKITNNMEFSTNSYHMPFSAQGRSANIQRYIEVNAFPSLPMYNPDGTYTRGGAATLGAFVDGNNYQNNQRNLFRNTVGFTTNFFDNTFRINGDYTFRYDDREFLSG
ncbi:SusC/RagA family TonB-linked outer membrane protein [Parapedobacter sp. 10938]|uniref:SusC/RagA family TonB-linked outer membrane protein n=1 Tax=Parapedobacter flavus TaxID=3110225 RepID=UPI002DBFC615|nr:SusC/RagA family TonB-linked outer membrane protein [Parapedobacter sp. 10938]MEC3880586.1 SusC/RagA family TonB-linked outer membrane protein [Parapedobacter sp. 10938]